MGLVEMKPKHMAFDAVLVLVGLWILIYLKDSLAYIAMYSSATYYWSYSDASFDHGKAEVMSGVKTAHVNHLGSLALGSFI